MFHKILFPVDFSESTDKALEHVARLASKLDSKVLILHVYEVLEDSIAKELGVDEQNPYLKKMEEGIIEKANAKIESLKTQIPSQNIETLVVGGTPKTTIIDICEKENCDLIVMGKHGYGFLKRFLIGSVSSYVLNHSESPVYLIG